MKRTLMASAASVLALGLAIGVTAQAETKPGFETPRTAWGKPDLQGFWVNTSVTSLQRPRGVDKLVVSEEEAVKVVDRNPLIILAREDNERQGSENLETDILADNNADRGYNAFWIDPGNRLATVKGEYRTSWIVEPADGRVPFKEGAAMKVYGTGYSPVNFDGPETRPLAERCLMSFSGSAGPVMQNGMYNNTFQFVQSPGALMINVEMNHDARIIPIDAEFNPLQPPKWAGDSRGWYDGDTLVVETRNPHPGQRALISEEGKLTERFTRWSEDEIFYEFTVEDPTLYTAAWKGEMALRRTDDPLHEYACHEGNYAMPGILGGARKIEAEGGTPSLGPGITAGINVPPAE